jgi:ribosomal protein S21
MRRRADLPSGWRPGRGTIADRPVLRLQEGEVVTDVMLRQFHRRTAPVLAALKHRRDAPSPGARRKAKARRATKRRQRVEVRAARGGA